MSEDFVGQDIYPWQQPWLAAWQAAMDGQRLTQGLCYYGEPGLGKKAFAHHIARRLLCQSTPDLCGTCAHCLLTSTGQHPDYVSIRPSGTQCEIKIDQIRAMAEQLQQTPLMASCQVVVIESIDRLNVPASHAVLKILEEPPGDVFIICVTDQPAQLLATLISRLQQFHCVITNDDWVAQWRTTGDCPTTWRWQQPLLSSHADSMAALVSQLLALIDGRLSTEQFAAPWEKQDCRSLLVDCAGICHQLLLPSGFQEYGEAGQWQRLQSYQHVLWIFYDLVLSHYRAYMSQPSIQGFLLAHDIACQWLRLSR